MKILVTGATGFIGQHIVTRLLTLGHDVITTSRTEKPANSWAGKTTHIPLNISDTLPKSLFTYFQSPDIVIHLAWSDLTDYYSGSHIEIQIPSQIGFLRNLISNGAKSISVAGTCFEYGLQNGCLREDTPTAPVTFYGHAKNSLRQSLEFLQKKYSFSFNWFRYFYMYGAGQHPKALLPQLDTAIENGDEEFKMSGGEQLRDYLPIEQVAALTVNAALNGNTEGIINICSGKPVSVRSLVEKRIQERGSAMKLNLGYYPYPDYEPMAFWGNVKKLKHLIGLTYE